MDNKLITRTIVVVARQKADEHKWNRSVEANRDLGPDAVREWADSYWPKLVRWCLVEHIRGDCLYEDFNEASYNILQVFRFGTSNLKQEIEKQIREGKENLAIINWAIDEGEDLNQVREFLAVVDVNATRFDCPLEECCKG